MLMDACQLEPGSVLDAAYCVIGSGMGGSSLAQKLASAGRDVLMVEAGGIAPNGNGSAPIGAESVGRPFGLPLTRAIELGGSSSRWHGICGPLDPIDFEPRPWIPDSGWPIRYADLEPFYVAAARDLGIRTLAHAEFGTMRERLADIRFNEGVLQNKVVDVPEPPRRWKDTVVRLSRAGRVRCLMNAPVLELVAGEAGDHVASLLAGSGRATFTVRSKTFIVCAGALETPRLLLNSRRRIWAGIGNERGLVGRYLLDHPMGHFCKLGFASRTRAPLYASAPAGPRLHRMAGLMLSPERQRADGLPNHYLWLRPSVSPARVDDNLLLSFLAVTRARDLNLRQIRAIVTNPDIRYRILVHRFGFRPRYLYGDMFFMTEQLPNPRSCVRLSDRRFDSYGYPVAQIDWQLSEADFRSFEAYAKLLLEHGLRSDRYRVARVDPPAIWKETLTGAAHHLGTARMADSPEQGVVDRDLKVFGIDNLYVCDGSVFTTAGSVNPSLTIMALAIRLGERLLARDTG